MTEEQGGEFGEGIYEGQDDLLSMDGLDADVAETGEGDEGPGEENWQSRAEAAESEKARLMGILNDPDQLARVLAYHKSDPARAGSKGGGNEEAADDFFASPFGEVEVTDDFAAMKTIEQFGGWTHERVVKPALQKIKREFDPYMKAIQVLWNAHQSAQKERAFAAHPEASKHEAEIQAFRQRNPGASYEEAAGAVLFQKQQKVKEGIRGAPTAFTETGAPRGRRPVPQQRSQQGPAKAEKPLPRTRETLMRFVQQLQRGQG